MAPLEKGSILGSRVRRVVVAVCAVSVLASTVALLYGSRLTTQTRSGGDSYDRGPIGHRAFLETLSELGVGAHRQREGYHDSAELPMIFIEPRPHQGGSANPSLSEVIRRREEKGLTTILVLPKWSYAEQTSETVVVPVPDSEVQSVIGAALSNSRPMSAGEQVDPALTHTLEGELGGLTVEIPWLRTISAPLGWNVLAGTTREALAIFSDSKRLMVISDPGIFHNVSLHRADHAHLWWRLLEHAGVEGEILVDEVFHGHWQRRSLGEALGGFPAVLMVIQALLLGLVAVAAGTNRFGAPLALAPPFERGPKDVVRLTAQVMAVGHSPALLSESYVEQTLDELTLRLGLDESAGIVKRAELIDDVLARRGRSRIARDLLDRVQTLASRGSDESAEPLRLAQRTWLLRRVLLDSAGLGRVGSKRFSTTTKR